MLKNNLLVLPSSRAIRHYIQTQKNKNQLLTNHISIGEFFQRSVLEKDNKKLCDKNLKLLYLKEAVLNVDIQKLGLSKDFTTFVSQSEYIFRFFQELSVEYVEFDELLQTDTYSLYSDHIEVLKEVYKNYIEILEKNDYTDNILIANNYILNDEYIKQYDSIKIHLEGYLSKFEYKIIEEAASLVNLHIEITLNGFNDKNIELFKIEDEEFEVGFRYIIDLTNKKIIEKEPLEVRTKNISINPALSKTLEVAFIKEKISSMVQKGIAPEKIVVIVPNETLSSYLELFDNEHYFNFAMGRGIKDNKISKTISTITKTLVDFEPKDEQKFNFYDIDKEKFEILFKQNWKKLITKENFEAICEYLFSLEEDDELLTKLEQIKLSLEVLLFTKIGHTNLDLTTKEFLKLLSNQISTITLDDTNGGKITVMGILETRYIAFEEQYAYDGVIIVDFNDDKIPKISVKDKFISSDLKSLVNLPTTTDRENLQRYYYKKLFDSCTDIAIAYIDDEASVMSRFIMQLFPNYKEYIKKQSFEKIIYNTKRLKYFEKDIVLDIDLSSLQWSATSLKSYLTCKREFYFNYIAKIKDHTISLKPQAYEIGNIIHDVLENMVKQNSINTIFINNEISKYQKTNPYLVLELELWKKNLEKLISLEKKRSNSGIQIFEVEKPFNLKYKDITIKGKIDRIDKYPDNTYEILDYKTSSSLKIDTPKTFEDSRDFQLEFYYLASRDRMVRDVSYYELKTSSIKEEVMLKEKLEVLDIHFEKLKTKQVNFEKTQNHQDCLYCAYKTICHR